MASVGEPSSFARLFEAARAVSAGRGPPPVHLWNPPRCGEIDIRIRSDGVWLHEGTPIGREALVRLFASVLRRDPDGVYLVTPAEKLKIAVDDAPFLARRPGAGGRDDPLSSPTSATSSRPAPAIRSGWRPPPTASRGPMCWCAAGWRR